MKDRRVKKTEQAIQAAFAKLLSEKSMENSKVKSLCETANINKSTFYLHYKDIYDCADCLRDTIVNELSKVFAPYNFAGIINNFSIIAFYNSKEPKISLSLRYFWFFVFYF